MLCLNKLLSTNTVFYYFQIDGLKIKREDGKKNINNENKINTQNYGRENDSNLSSDESVVLSKAEKSLLQKVVRKGLIESKHDIEVQRKDPTSPLFSVKTFEALHL